MTDAPPTTPSDSAAALRAVVRRGEPTEREAALEALGHVGDPAASDIVAHAASTVAEPLAIRVAAIRAAGALARLGDETSLELLSWSVIDVNGEVAQAAAEEIATVPDLRVRRPSSRACTKRREFRAGFRYAAPSVCSGNASKSTRQET